MRLTYIHDHIVLVPRRAVYVNENNVLVLLRVVCVHERYEIGVGFVSANGAR